MDSGRISVTLFFFVHILNYDPVNQNLIIAFFAILCLIASNTSSNKTLKTTLKISFVVLLLVAAHNTLQDMGFFGAKHN